jgi:CheY-like chemotaxis protein
MMDNFAYNNFNLRIPSDDLEVGLDLRRKKKVMVIDDDQDLRLTVCEMLVDEGFLVTTAKDGESGLNQLIHQNDPPDIILLDVMMPVKSGIEFRREQLKLEGIGKIPVVFMTGYDHFDGGPCLLKPLDQKELIKIILRHLN